MWNKTRVVLPSHAILCDDSLPYLEVCDQSKKLHEHGQNNQKMQNRLRREGFEHKNFFV